MGIEKGASKIPGAGSPYILISVNTEVCIKSVVIPIAIKQTKGIISPKTIERIMRDIQRQINAFKLW
ncbi:MAG: hypothetical protein M3209_08615 [Acidobacteriota bacterium]|nr:hypothetical protein [Acidobacteriota bacterium]